MESNEILEDESINEKIITRKEEMKNLEVLINRVTAAEDRIGEHQDDLQRTSTKAEDN